MRRNGRKQTICRASLTVETALLLPLFLLGMLTMISFLEIYPLQTQTLAALCDRAKELGVYACLQGEPEELTLPSVRRWQSPIAALPLPPVFLENRVTVHTWTGFSTDDAKDETGEPQEMVYVAAHGSVYHTQADCTHIALSVRQTAGSTVEEQRNRYGEKYRPCESCCAAGETPEGLVYVTDSGTRWHSSAGCSGLKRTVRLVKKAEVTLTPCGKCGGTDG